MMTWRTNQNHAEPETTEPDPVEQKEDTVESMTTPMDPSVQLEADLKAAKTEAAEWQDRFLRKAAEFENFRKRAEKEKTDSMYLAKSSVLVEFLPIADACERALLSIGEARTAPGSLEQYQEGVELLYKQLLDALSRTGVMPIKVEGKPFDPHLHEALSREETIDYKEDTVVRELRRGYLFKEKLLRPAQVIVAVHPRDKDKAS
jgi:molecular chaperone GrpE